MQAEMRIDTYLLLVIGMVLMCSCNRKSGRLQSTSKPRTEQKYRKEEHVSSSNNSGQIMTAKQIFQKYNEAVFMVFTSDGYNSFQGSGFFISSKGIAVSNYHVFRGTAVGLEVIKLSSGDELRIDEVIAKSEENDFIVFKVQASKRRNFTYIPISKRDFSVGDKIYTIGSPRGLENTFLWRDISEKGR